MQHAASIYGFVRQFVLSKKNCVSVSWVTLWVRPPLCVSIQLETIFVWSLHAAYSALRHFFSIDGVGWVGITMIIRLLSVCNWTSQLELRQWCNKRGPLHPDSRTFIVILRYDQNNALLSQYYIFEGRNIEEVFCSSHRKKFPVWGKYFLSQEEISYDTKKFTVTERNFLSQGQNSCHRKKISSDRTKSQVTEWNSISDQRKKFPVAGRYFPLQDKISCH